MVKNFLKFFALGFYTVGAIGGFGYATYIGEWFTALCVLVLAVMAWPTAKSYFLSLKSN